MFELPEQLLTGAMLSSLLSVWVLVGIFAYLNRYTRRRYFGIWTTAWLFYALWLTLLLNTRELADAPLPAMLRQWSVSLAAAFLIWGNVTFLGLAAPERLFGWFMAFLLVWGGFGAYYLGNPLEFELPVFALAGAASLLNGGSFLRVRLTRPRFVGAGLLAAGFGLLGVYLVAHPLLSRQPALASASFFACAVIQLFIAVSMIVLVLQEAEAAEVAARLEADTQRIERQAVQLELVRQQHETDTLNALARMMSGVAHQLNNPVGLIQGTLELLLHRPTVPAALRPELERMQQQAQRAARLVKQFVAFARQKPLKLDRVQLNDLVRQAVAKVWPNPRRDGVEVQYDLAADLPETLADAEQLQHVFQNLLTNAAQALAGAPAPRRVCIRSRADAQGLEVRIADNGPGISPEVAPRIFEPFFTTKPVGQGAGLGLSVAHSVVAEHRGRLEFAPAPGGGAAFRIGLPLLRTREELELGAGPGPAAAAGARPQALRVLVLDDEPDFARMVGECLKILGHHPTVCVEAEAALEAAARQEFDLVLSDFNMPQMDGQGFYERLVAGVPRLASRIVFITGDDVSRQFNAFFRTHQPPYLVKPFQLEQLRTVLDRVGTPPERAFSGAAPPGSAAGPPPSTAWPETRTPPGS